MNFFLHLKESASTAEKQVFPVGDGITSANSLLSAKSKKDEQFELIRQNGSLILHNQIEGTKINGEILAKDARKKLELNDEIFFDGHAFILSNQIDEIKRVTLLKNAIITVPSKSDQKTDSFYLEIDNHNLGNQKIPLNLAKSILGWSKKGEIITANADEIETELVFLEKNWSGIIAHSIAPKTVWINGQILKSPQKLAAGDVLTFSLKKGSSAVKSIKVSFVEPPPSVSFSSFSDGLILNDECDFNKSVLARSYLKTVEKKAFLVNTNVLKSNENKTEITRKSVTKPKSVFKISRQKVAESTIETKQIVETKPIVKVEPKRIEVKPIEAKKPVVVEAKPIETKPIEAKKVEAKPIAKVETKSVKIEKPKVIAPSVIAKTPIVEKKIEPKIVERKPLEIGKKFAYVKDEVVARNFGNAKTNFANYSKTFGAMLAKVWETSNGWTKIALAKSKSFGAVSFAKSKTVASFTKSKLVALKAPTKTGLQKLGEKSKTATVALSAKTVTASKSIGKLGSRSLETTGNLLKKGAQTSGKAKTKLVDVLQTNLPKLKAKSANLFSFVSEKVGAGIKTIGTSVGAGVKALGETVHKAKDASANKVSENFDALKTQTTKGLSALKENTTEKIETLKANTSSGVSSLKANTSSGISTLKTQSANGISSLKSHASTNKENLGAGLTKIRAFITGLTKNEAILKFTKNEFVQLISATTVGSVAVFFILQLLMP